MIFRKTTFADAMLRHDFRMARIELSALDMKCFQLESRLRRLEIDWRYSNPDKNHRLRMERMRIRHEFEMLKIDLRNFERRAEPLFKSLT
jgi:hypothetical protein